MRSHPILITAALILSLAGVGLLFAPEVVLPTSLTTDRAFLSAIVQLYGTALFGLGVATWTIRAATAGGIYARAVVLGNFAHALAGVLVLFGVAWRAPTSLKQASPPTLVAFIGYAVLFVIFGRLLLGAPVSLKAADR